MMENIPFPYILIDKKLDILKKNKLFEKEFQCENVLDIVPKFDLDKAIQTFVANNSVYNVYTQKQGENNALYFVKYEYKNCGIIVGLLIIDNYNEVQESTEETRHLYLMAVVDRKISEYFAALDGIARKFEKDRYIFVIGREKLKVMKEEKFSIMETLAKIDMGNTPVSVSIGMGLYGETPAQSMELARGAVDLALGRGGNQVVIKEGQDIYHFVGGSGRESSHNSGVRARTKFYGLIELIISASNVLIMGHRNPDLDSLGSSAGMFAIVNFFGKPCNIVLSEISRPVENLYNRLMEDIKYKDCFISGEEALKLVKRKTLVIVLDVHKADYCDCPKLLDTKAKLVVIDHHRKSPDAIENYDLTYHESFASSASELVTEMLMYGNKPIKLTKTEAEGLLAGITVDTKNFAFKTGKMTFEAASYLKTFNADTVSVRRLFQSPLKDYVAKVEIVKNAKTVFGNMALSTLEQEVSDHNLITAQAADELLNIQGIEASFVIYCRDNKAHISARSLGKVNVQRLMEKLGGGGHQTGAACDIDNINKENAEKLLIDTIDSFLKEENI